MAEPDKDARPATVARSVERGEGEAEKKGGQRTEDPGDRAGAEEDGGKDEGDILRFICGALSVWESKQSS